jgi:hypothetical protein
MLGPDCDGRYDNGRLCMITDHPLNAPTARDLGPGVTCDSPLLHPRIYNKIEQISGSKKCGLPELADPPSCTTANWFHFKQKCSGPKVRSSSLLDFFCLKLC